MAVSIIQNYGNGNNPSDQAFAGPLAALYNNRYAFDSLQYPRDLGSSYKGHIVKFDIYEVVPKTLNEIKDYVISAAEAGAKATANGVVAGVQAVGSVATTAYDKGVSAAAEQIGQSVAQGWDKLTSGQLTSTTIQISPQISGVKASISLYMPDTVDFQYASQYNNLSLADAAGSLPLVGGIAKAITSGEYGVGNNAALKLGLNAAGYVFNPQQQLLFEGIDFRTYNMSFTFTPSSPQESENVKNIIQTFRKYAAPTVVTGAAGFFFNPPGMVDVSFLYNGTKNPNLNYIKRSVIENIDVNYAPNGWAAHEDGAPVQTTITIQFKEMFLVDRKAIEQGY